MVGASFTSGPGVRILQIAPPWFAVPPQSYGGIEQIVATLTDGLVAAGHDVVLLASGGSRTTAQLQTVYDTPPSTDLGDAFTELPHVISGYVRRHEFDLIHDHTGIGMGMAVVADGPPVVHTLHGPWTPAAERLYTMVADRVNLVGISHDQARRAPAGVRIAAVVHNGIDMAAHPRGSGAGGHLAFVGRASPEKGPEVAVEVARRLGLPLRMAIKVNEEAEQRYWDDVIAPRIGAGVIEVLHNVTHDQKLRIMGEAAAVLVPIAWPEPFGLVMVEANAVGTPVVAYATGAAPEVLADGRTGILVDPDDIDAFTSAVGRATQLDRGECRDHAVANFSSRRMVDRYAALYHRLRLPSTPRMVVG